MAMQSAAVASPTPAELAFQAATEAADENPEQLSLASAEPDYFEREWESSRTQARTRRLTMRALIINFPKAFKSPDERLADAILEKISRAIEQAEARGCPPMIQIDRAFEKRLEELSGMARRDEL